STDATVLIMGETGVGKDVFARLTHRWSRRKDKILLKVDCGGISETLTESEIFGYVPGAFTGASSKGKPGYFEIADGSTIFLDEVGELPLSMQTRLLRVLQDNEIVRVGSSQPRKVDVRIIAATNRNLEECVEAGTFRRDLFYRLNVGTVRIPPLRERPEDVRVLAELFLRQYTTKYRKKLAFMDITLDMLAQYRWPGNVRELQNLVHSLVITRQGPRISPRDLPSNISGLHDESGGHLDAVLMQARPLREIIADMERDFLRRAIEVHGSVRRVSELFQVNRSTIFRKLQGSKGHDKDEESAS
ncbi:MAG: sigma 54-interacting transcriptional regulator, partial [Desulfovibrio piger]